MCVCVCVCVCVCAISCSNYKPVNFRHAVNSCVSVIFTVHRNYFRIKHYPETESGFFLVTQELNLIRVNKTKFILQDVYGMILYSAFQFVHFKLGYRNGSLSSWGGFSSSKANTRPTAIILTFLEK